MTAPDNGMVETPASPAPSLAPTVDDIIATEVLFSRPSRPPDYQAENEALTRLVEVMSQSPEAVLQKLADTALTLCGAGSAGISIAEVEGNTEIFRWRATSGNYTQYLGGTMPRYFSPCGAVLERDAPLLMVQMVRYYDYVSQLNLPPYEVLLVPFHNQGKAVGTVWVVAHDETRRFDKEDLRILRSLTNFAAIAVQTFARTQELEAANAAARELGETREQFMAVLGHDLRNPLGAIVNGATLLQGNTPAERLAPIARIIGSSAARIGELVDNLLDFTRGRLGGGISIQRQSTGALESTLTHVIDELRAAYPGRLVESRFDLAAPADVDADRIGQMVSNLLGNAFVHGDPAQPIRVAATSTEDMLLVSVCNGGKPIPQDVQDKLFKPFERGSDGNKDGLGLGLYISSEIAKAHGAKLSVTSTDEGTIFRFVMPQGTGTRPAQ